MSANKRKYDFPLCLMRDESGKICGREASFFDLDRAAWVCPLHGKRHAKEDEGTSWKKRRTDGRSDMAWFLRFGA